MYHFMKKWEAIVMRGPSIGKNIPRVERRYIRIDFVGTILIIIPFAVPSRPITPKKKPIIFPKRPKIVLGILLNAFFVLSFILYQRLRSSNMISRTSLGVYIVVSTSLKRGTTSFLLSISSSMMKICISFT